MRFSPGIYEHAAACIGRRPGEIHRNTELLAETDQIAMLDTARDFPQVHVRVNIPSTLLLDPAIIQRQRDHLEFSELSPPGKAHRN